VSVPAAGGTARLAILIDIRPVVTAIANGYALSARFAFLFPESQMDKGDGKAH
jgi:hypothetical protein